MKPASNNILRAILFCTSLSLSAGCTKEFLEPEPLSFFEPSVTFTTPEGLQAAITTCNRNLSYVWTGEAPPLLTDYLFSDIAVNGTTDKSGPAQDLNALITPSANNNSVNTNKIHWFWYEGYKGIKYANTVITNLPRVEGLDSTDALYKQMMGMAYFHRAFRYLWLVFSFGDVPLLTKEVETPKVNFRPTKREVILEKMTQDLEYAVANVPATGDYGQVTKGACMQLLIKYYLATGRFDEAINTANQLINNMGYALMQNNFGTFINPSPAVHPVTRNVIWDLHRPQNKSIPANKETIYNLISREDFVNSRQDMQTMRNATPFYAGTGNQLIRTPSGKQGMSTSYSQTKDKIDLRRTYGRGIAVTRPTWYAQNTIWDDPDDLRHSTAVGNWMNMENLVYNHPTLQSQNDPWYGQPLQMYHNGQRLVVDTIRTWFSWPHYKIWVEQPRAEAIDNYNGGPADWYIFRLAETYLLRAEAHFWKGELDLAAQDVNTIRQRAHCTKLYTGGEMNIGVILDERARELYYEELRHLELSRISYIFATTGKPDEFGKTYTLETLSQNNYWFERITRYNNFYNKGVSTVYGATFTASPYHILWPIAQSEINSNRQGHLNQPFGYAGHENNVEPYSTLEEAMEAENN
jgi:SusD family.